MTSVWVPVLYTVAVVIVTGLGVSVLVAAWREGR